MDTVEAIIEHLKLADGDESEVSYHRWEASRLIWEEIKAGKSRRGLAGDIGKSHTHVRYMFNCWELVGRKLEVSDPHELPNFQEIYMSSEVRGEPDNNPGDDKRDRRNRREPDPEDDVSAHGLTLRAANALDTLNRNEAFWPLLTDDDVAVLREAGASLGSILAGIGRLSAINALTPRTGESAANTASYPLTAY